MIDTRVTLPADLTARIETLLASHPVVLFMKGEPAAPLCGFSAKACAMLRHLGADFAAVNILEDDELRHGLKDYSDWPTYPQLYVKAELIGGADIMAEMFQSGELATLLQTTTPTMQAEVKPAD